MLKPILAAGAAVLLMGTVTVAHAEDQAVVIDYPDLQALNKADQGARLRDLVGTEVYSNKGMHIGEIEGFVLARGGYLYAVIDYSNSPIEELAEFVDPDSGDAVVPWNQIRTMPESRIQSMQQQSELQK